ncbi:MAG TPA: hypothetical protein VNA28_08615 [Solirubrobacteraceae bacterium]|nr:hypothetical protein [Solirubrobacteraceae bacterium]
MVDFEGVPEDMSWLELFAKSIAYLSGRVFLTSLAIAVFAGLVTWVA